MWEKQKGHGSHTYTLVCVCVRVHAHVHLCVCVCGMCVCVSVCCVSLCICVLCVYMCMSLCMCLSVVCVCMCLCVHVCVVCVSLCVGICVSLCVLCACVFFYVYEYVSLCDVWTHMSACALKTCRPPWGKDSACPVEGPVGPCTDSAPFGAPELLASLNLMFSGTADAEKTVAKINMITHTRFGQASHVRSGCPWVGYGGWAPSSWPADSTFSLSCHSEEWVVGPFLLF